MINLFAHAGEEHSSTSEAAQHIGSTQIIVFILITAAAFTAGFIVYKLLNKTSDIKVKQTKEVEEKK